MNIQWDKYVSPAKAAADVRDQALASVQAKRLLAYREESNPLKTEAEFDAIKAGVEPDYGAWIAKVEEVKSRYPMPE